MALIKVANSENAPLHLFLGEDAFEMAKQKIALLGKALEENKEISISTSF